jgi:hypothetical protein
MARKNGSRVVEHGDIFFFYRPRVGAEEVSDIEDVQRFYMVTAPAKGKYRLFMVGQKQLPEIVEGRSTSEERNWALNVLATSNAEEIRKELLAIEYETETMGKRRLPAASPVGEGKYSIVEHDNHTELAYILELPEMPGRTQKEFDIKKEASYVIAVKNPKVTARTPGFAALDRRTPHYPQEVVEKFGDRRWINAEPEILNYQNTQVLLVGARKKGVEEELGIDLDEEKENENTAELFRDLKIKKSEVPLRPLLKGEFPSRSEAESAAEKGEVRNLSKMQVPGRGGKRGGRTAATKVPSAASIAKVLSGARFPINRDSLLRHAKTNRAKTGVAEEVVEVIRQLPDRTYDSMADVERGLGQIA